jgi:transcriptional regulator with XRE-family HTH domain
MSTPHDICTALRAYRMRARLRQRTVASALGVAQSQVSRWENGLDTPRAHHAAALERLLWGADDEPLAVLRHRVSGSSRNLLLLDRGFHVLARANPFMRRPDPLQRFGWVLDPRANPAAIPFHARYRALMENPRGATGIVLALPFVDADERWTVHMQAVVCTVSEAAICLAELAFAPAEDGDAAPLLNETCLEQGQTPAPWPAALRQLLTPDTPIASRPSNLVDIRQSSA